MAIKISYAKPNPVGKDKNAFGQPKPEQLLGEWVDVTNSGSENIRLGSIQLHHTRFDEYCHVKPQATENYWSGAGSGDFLKPGQTLRIHTGKKRDEALLNSLPYDKGSVAWRAFADLDRFVLNNRCGDVIYVTYTDGRGSSAQDKAGYNNNPPEGVVLHRSGDKLVP